MIVDMPPGAWRALAGASLMASLCDTKSLDEAFHSLEVQLLPMSMLAAPPGGARSEGSATPASPNCRKRLAAPAAAAVSSSPTFTTGSGEDMLMSSNSSSFAASTTICSTSMTSAGCEDSAASSTTSGSSMRTSSAFAACSEGDAPSMMVVAPPAGWRGEACTPRSTASCLMELAEDFQSLSSMPRQTVEAPPGAWALRDLGFSASSAE
mmetsp:Transcript_32687/g.58706  ORF Transcript_32687/g.58706 Transcript_32687/m.58706 type:complete len:209 (-) Transcript_32687:54-680(-)